MAWFDDPQASSASGAAFFAEKEKGAWGRMRHRLLHHGGGHERDGHGDGGLDCDHVTDDKQPRGQSYLIGFKPPLGAPFVTSHVADGFVLCREQPQVHREKPRGVTEAQRLPACRRGVEKSEAHRATQRERTLESQGGV